jgi:hypothetical protein
LYSEMVQICLARQCLNNRLFLTNEKAFLVTGRLFHYKNVGNRESAIGNGLSMCGLANRKTANVKQLQALSYKP